MILPFSLIGEYTDILSNRDFFLIVELSSKINDGCSNSHSSRCYPDAKSDMLPHGAMQNHTEIITSGLAVMELFKDPVVHFHFQCYDSTGYTLRIISYFKTNEPGLK